MNAPHRPAEVRWVNASLGGWVNGAQSNLSRVDLIIVANALVQAVFQLRVARGYMVVLCFYVKGISAPMTA